MGKALNHTEEPTLNDAQDYYALLRFEEAALGLRTAFQLDLVERIGSRVLTTSEFQDEFQFTSQAARTFGALLSVMNVIEPVDSDHWRVTELARNSLASEAEFTRRPYLAMGNHPEVDAFVDLLQGRNDPSSPALYGRDGEAETLMDVDEIAQAVSFGLASRAKCFAQPLAKAIADQAHPELTTLADIGAGSPYVVWACRRLMPYLTTTKLVDRANGMKYVRQMLTAIDGSESDFELCEQDFFQSVPAADIYSISNTAHDWLEPEYLEIMTHVREAISLEGFICIHEPLLVTSWATKHEWLEALWMACYAMTLFRLTHGKGSCYTVAEHDLIQQTAGFSRSADPIRTVDGCTALFYRLTAADQDSTS